MNTICQQQLLIWLAIVLVPNCGHAQQVTDDEIMNVQAKELAVLGMTLPHYKVQGVSSIDALKMIWVVATGEQPALIRFEYANRSLPEPKITLDINDTKVSTIIGYIAELSASRWQLRGWSGLALTLSLKSFEDGQGEWTFTGGAFELQEARADDLGIKPSMKPHQVMDVLSRFGVEFDLKRNAMAAYNEKLGILVIAAGDSEVTYAGSLARLLNAGMTIQKKEAKAR